MKSSQQTPRRILQPGAMYRKPRKIRKGLRLPAWHEHLARHLPNTSDRVLNRPGYGWQPSDPADLGVGLSIFSLPGKLVFLCCNTATVVFIPKKQIRFVPAKRRWFDCTTVLISWYQYKMFIHTYIYIYVIHNGGLYCTVRYTYCTVQYPGTVRTRRVNPGRVWVDEPGHPKHTNSTTVLAGESKAHDVFIHSFIHSFLPESFPESVKLWGQMTKVRPISYLKYYHINQQSVLC